MKIHIDQFLFSVCFSTVAWFPAVFAQAAEEPRLGNTTVRLPLITEKPVISSEAPLQRYCGVALSTDELFVLSYGSLYRLQLPLEGQIEIVEPEEIRVGNRSNPSHEVRYIDGKLYVFKVYDRVHTEYFLVSDDNGDSFIDLTQEFYFPDLRPTAPYWPPSDIVLSDGTYYVTPDRRVNLFYRSPNHEWLSVYGDRELKEQGIGREFTVHDGVVVWGGEGVALDYVEIWRGELSATGDSWATEPYLVHSTTTDGIPSNRNVNGVEANPLTNTIFLGVEGGILRSDNRGEAFSYTLRYEGDPLDPGDIGVDPGERERRPYVGPYIHQFLFPSHDATQVLAAGWDKGHDLAYLTWSKDDGKTWTNITSILEDYITESSSTVFLFETSHGDIFAGVGSHPEQSLTLVEIELPSGAGSYFSEADYGGSGYWNTDAIGWTYGGWFPWIWIHQQGVWAYVSGASEENMWLWDGDLGWLWTSRVITPFYYRQDTDSYLYYAPESRHPRWFYDMKTDQWTKVP